MICDYCDSSNKESKVCYRSGWDICQGRDFRPDGVGSVKEEFGILRMALEEIRKTNHNVAVYLADRAIKKADEIRGKRITWK